MLSFAQKDGKMCICVHACTCVFCKKKHRKDKLEIKTYKGER